MEVAAGTWLFRGGDAAQSAYLVLAGRLEVVAEGPSEAVIRELKRGAVLGELGLLREEVRSASVRARRDSELLELRREDFDALLRGFPDFAVALTTSLATQLAANRTARADAPDITTVAVVGLDPAAPAAQVAERLSTGLRRHGTLARLDGADAEQHPGDLSAFLGKAERDHDRVLLAGGSDRSDDPWTAFRLREVDLVVAVASRPPDAVWTRQAPALRGCELLVAGPGPSDDLLAGLDPRQVTVRRDGAALLAAVDVLARRLAGRSTALVFSGGGARAFAHLGVLDELRCAGITFDRVAGVSLGSVIAGSVAMGWEPDQIYEVFTRYFVDQNPTNDYTLPSGSVLRGAKARGLLEEVAGDVRIEELPISFFCESCDLVAREVVVHRTGLVRDAVYASLAIPGVFPPVVRGDGRVLVDGGVLDNLPVARMAHGGEGPVIASDVTAGAGRWTSRKRAGSELVARRVRRLLTGTEQPLPTLGETMLSTLTLGSIDTVAASREHAALSIRPQVEDAGLLDFKQLPRLREAGRRAARVALAQADLDVFADGA